LLKNLKKHEGRRESSFEEMKKVHDKILGVKKEILNLFKIIKDEESIAYAEEFKQTKALTAENLLGALGQIENMLLRKYVEYG
jgi:hypothetical protein